MTRKIVKRSTFLRPPILLCIGDFYIVPFFYFFHTENTLHYLKCIYLLLCTHSQNLYKQVHVYCIWKKLNVKNFISVFIRKKTDFWNLFMTKFEFLYLWMKQWWLVSEKKDQVIFFLSSLLTIISFSCLSLNRHPSLFSILNKKNGEWMVNFQFSSPFNPPPPSHIPSLFSVTHIYMNMYSLNMDRFSNDKCI